MKFTQAGLSVIKVGEGCKLSAYQDSVGVWTIGYGHTGLEVQSGLTWTQQQAEDTLAQQIEAFASSVQHVITNTKISDNQFSALVSLSYNIGLRNFASSSVLRETNAGNLTAVPPAFLLYDKAHDRATGQIIVIAGLQNRRQSEVKLWNTPDSGSNPAVVPAPTATTVSPGPAPTPVPPPPTPLRAGDSGAQVRLLQHYLITKGHFMDGMFGPQTDSAVKEFQRANGLVQDGVVGPVTWKVLTGLTP